MGEATDALILCVVFVVLPPVSTVIGRRVLYPFYLVREQVRRRLPQRDAGIRGVRSRGQAYPRWCRGRKGSIPHREGSEGLHGERRGKLSLMTVVL